MTVDVSIMICTRDRAARLGATLASVTRAAAAAPAVAIEAILVDNGSLDRTPRRLAEWCATQRFPTLVVDAPTPGLATARNAGLARAHGRLVAMTDDDCVLHDDYLRAIVAAFGARDRPAIVGGRVLPGDPGDLPVTVKLEDHPMILRAHEFPGGFVMGANLALTGDVVARIGGFDERFGAGAAYRAAEDTDLLIRARRAGIPVSYDPRIVVDHHHGRRDPREVRRLMAGYAFGDGALYAKHLWRNARIGRAILADVRDLARDLAPGGTAPFDGFYRHRLGHKAAGFLAFHREKRSARPARRA